MNINDLHTQLLYSTAPIWVELSDGQQRSGTSFFYMHTINKAEGSGIPFLITNYHVVNGAKRALIEVVLSEGDKPSKTKKLKVELDNNLLNQYYDEKLDLVAIPIGFMMHYLLSNSQSIFIRTISEDMLPTEEQAEELSALEDIVFIGYPSGFYDSHNSTPLIRKGITATPVWNNFNGDASFLIDAGVFPGSSGSPVLIANSGGYNSGGGIVVGTRVLFLGVLTESIIQPKSDSSSFYLGLGKVRNFSSFKTFINDVALKIKLKESIK